MGEVLTLNSGTRFEGELVSMNPQSGVLVDTPRTPELLAFKLDSFSLLEMEGPIESDPFQTERLVLANGDILPGNLRALNGEEIVYEGLVGGQLNVKRNQVTTLRFGIKPQSIQYEGPSPLSEWSGSGVDAWEVSSEESQGLFMSEPGNMQQDLNLGSQFILKFDLRWQERPAVRIYFGSDGSGDARQNRYYIDLNSSGIKIRRERADEPQYHSLVTLNQLEAFDDKMVSVELRVNRLIGTLDLYLDDELVRQMLDTAPPTEGNFLAIDRKRSDNSTSYLSNLKVFSWDAVSQIELLEEPAAGDIDSLVDAEGKRISGQILGLYPQENENEVEIELKVEEEGEEEVEIEVAEKPTPPHFLLKSPFAEDPVEIPTNKTRIIYFKDSLKNAPPSVFPKYELDLANDGLISATTLSMTDDQITLEHPLLGSLDVPRSAVKQIRHLKKLTDEDE